VSGRNPPERIGVFGGTFDPIHFAHLVIAQEAAARLDLARVLFIPAGSPPHKAALGVTDGAQRLAMVECAVAGNPRFAVSTIELDAPGPSYTVETLARLRNQYGDATALYLVLGGDMVYDLAGWRDPAGIVAQLAGLIAAHRPGYGFTTAQLTELERRVPGLGGILHPLATPQLDISATVLRDRVAQGLPIRYLTPDAVVQYIYKHELYKASATTGKEAQP
jgi:nicotinate-nucleotide adenylyltransferase